MLAVSVAAGSSQAATPEEVANISVTSPADFRCWNADSPALRKIVRFVEDAKNPHSAGFIPAEDRIAVFDMDGTFYCETAPLYFQETMFLYRALDDKGYRPDRKMARFAAKVRPKILNKPVLAFGNSMGDSGMFEFTLQDNTYPSAAFCVLCDDTEWELGDLKKAGSMKQTAIKRGWDTISMRDEFRTIYGEGVTRAAGY
jgi:hypothetical protein